MYKSVSPLQEIFNMAGMQLPNYLKRENIEEADVVDKPTPKKESKTNPKPKKEQ